MPNIFVTSDTHFGHSRIIEHCLRPFASEDEMNNALVSNWNSVVAEKDTVIHLGDVGWRNVEHWASQLNGHKILVAGNHDKKMNHNTKKMFMSIYPIWDTKISGQQVVFCHYPMHAWNRSHRGSLHLHGHSHGAGEEMMSYLRWDMSVDVWNFKPVPWDVIMEKYRYKKPGWEQALKDMVIGRDIKNRNDIIELNKKFWK